MTVHAYHEYSYGPRAVLESGDQFRARGGPFYRTAGGRKVPMADHGLMIFNRYCEHGASKWIEAYKPGLGMVVLWVGRRKLVDGLVMRPYKVSKVLAKGASRV